MIGLTRIKDETRGAPLGRKVPLRLLRRAIESRDSLWDGRFVFAVRSTGVYCRPSCPARRPHPQNVEFFSNPEAAEKAGFRACRRCRPQEPSQSGRFQILNRVCRLIEATDSKAVRLPDLAIACGISAGHLQRTFRRYLGVSPHDYAEAIKLRRLKSRLREGANVTTALYDAGYGSASRLYERSDRQLGMTPAAYRRGGQGMEISYSIVSTPLGRLLVGATARGLSAVYLGESVRKLESELRREYPMATIRKDPKAVSQWLKAVVDCISGIRQKADLPLDVVATAFQRRVWEELQRIPYGRTVTYRELARSLGYPSGARAVARACATNPVSIVVPCHRVVRGDGSLAGYRWGLERKRDLLAQEKSTANTAKQRKGKRQFSSGV